MPDLIGLDQVNNNNSSSRRVDLWVTFRFPIDALSASLGNTQATNVNRLQLTFVVGSRLVFTRTHTRLRGTEGRRTARHRPTDRTYPASANSKATGSAAVAVSPSADTRLKPSSDLRVRFSNSSRLLWTHFSGRFETLTAECCCVKTQPVFLLKNGYAESNLQPIPSRYSCADFRYPQLQLRILDSI